MVFFFPALVETLQTLSDIRDSFQFDVCMTVYHWYNDINNQLDATLTVY